MSRNSRIPIKIPVIVEGKYDKIKLSSIFEGVIISIEGFSIYKNKEKIKLLQKYAKETGIAILTDSDGAGFMIRNFLKGIVPQNSVTNIYIPQIEGKEKRKKIASKEGLLGVEGINSRIIIKAFEKAGIIENDDLSPNNVKIFTKAMLFDDGLFGGENSSNLRAALLKELNLPNYLSTNALIEALNSFCTPEQYRQILTKIKG